MPGALQANPPLPQQPATPGGGMAGTGAPGQPQQGPAPAPSHQETVCALRHFHALAQELQTLLKNPDLGKSDLKSDIIDGMTQLVGDRIIPAGQAVMQLATVPDRPFEQKQWVEDHYVKAVMASSSVLDHHRAANRGTGNYALESMIHKNDPGNHMSTMAGMMKGHYGAGR